MSAVNAYVEVLDSWSGMSRWWKTDAMSGLGLCLPGPCIMLASPVGP